MIRRILGKGKDNLFINCVILSFFREKSLQDLRKIWSEIQSLEKLPTKDEEVRKYENLTKLPPNGKNRNFGSSSFDKDESHIRKLWPENYDSIQQVQNKVRTNHSKSNNSPRKSKQTQHKSTQTDEKQSKLICKIM